MLYKNPRLLLILANIQPTQQCRGSFIGLGCEPCPASLYCDSTAHPCPGAVEGSRACNYPVPALKPLTTHRHRAQSSFTPAKVRANPSNRSCGCFTMSSSLWVVLDAGELVVVGGVASQGREGAWVSSFLVDTSLDNRTWAPLGGVYAGNSDDVSVVETRSPFVVLARFVRLQVVNFFLWPSFRAALLVADTTTCPASRVCSNASVLPCPANQVCANGTALACPAGRYCSNGTAYRCPANSSCVDGAITCRAVVGSLVRWNGTACEYRCRPGTFGDHCQPRPAYTRNFVAGPASLRCSVVNRRRPPVACRLHNDWGLELPSWNGSTAAAVQTDGSPWMAWNFKAGSSIMPLPRPVATRVRVRVWWAKSYVMEFVGRPTASVALAVAPSPIAIRWGIGNGTVGDSQALCSVTAPHGMALELRTAAFPSYHQALGWTGEASDPVSRWDLNCANMSERDIRWLTHNTEIEGMDQSLLDFSRNECRREASTWLMPQTDRVHSQFVAVLAVAS